MATYDYVPSSEGLFPPRPLRSDVRLGRRLLLLEVPDCDCPLLLSCPCREACPPDTDCPHCLGKCDCEPLLWQPPCEHVRSTTHSLSLERWAELLAAYDPGPGGIEGPPIATSCGLALTRDQLLALYEKRAHAGRALRRPGDRTALTEAQDAARTKRIVQGQQRSEAAAREQRYAEEAFARARKADPAESAEVAWARACREAAARLAAEVWMDDSAVAADVLIVWRSQQQKGATP